MGGSVVCAWKLGYLWTYRSCAEKSSLVSSSSQLSSQRWSAAVPPLVLLPCWLAASVSSAGQSR